MLDITELWFKRAVPVRTEKNVQTQISVHTEEVCEFLGALEGVSDQASELLDAASAALKAFTKALRSGEIQVQVADRKEMLDALCDQIVTATGVGYMCDMNVVEGMDRVNASNFSKFDTNGMPIFDANGKIAKNKDTYKPANLEGLY